MCCVVVVLQDDVAHLPDALLMALAAQAYAKSELLWYFRHVGDKLPPPPTAPAASKLTGQLLGQAPKSHQLADDGQVVALVAAAAALYDLLVRGGAMPLHTLGGWGQGGLCGVLNSVLCQLYAKLSSCSYICAWVTECGMV